MRCARSGPTSFPAPRNQRRSDAAGSVYGGTEENVKSEAFDALHPTTEIACGEFARLRDRAGDRDGFVVAVVFMYRDLKRGLPVEVDTILGDLLHRGQQHGLKTPLLQAAFVSLSIYERERKSG